MPDKSLDQVIENVIRETVPRSIRLKVTIAQSRRRIATARGSTTLELKQDYAETDRGERYFDERLIIPNALGSHKQSYSDGKRCANVTFSRQSPETQTEVTIGHDFMTESKFGFVDAPPPFRYYHVGLVPLHKALHTAEYVGRDRVIERTCDNFHFKEVGPSGMRQSLLYSLDLETTIPLKIAAFANAEQLRAQVPNWVWEATSLDQVSGRHFVKSSKYSTYHNVRAAGGDWVSEPDLNRAIHVDEVSFDQSIPREFFWPKIGDGVIVLDAISKHNFRTAGGTSGNRETAATETLIRVPRHESSRVSEVGVVFSLAALLMAVVLWRRTR